MANKIITIGRQFGSNGREIGRELATKLGIPFYDKELLNETAKNSGMSEAVLKTLDERPSKRIETIMQRFNLTYDKAKSQIAREDKARASYYNFYTSKKWGALDSYDVFINSSLMSIEDNVEFIIGYIDKMGKK